MKRVSLDLEFNTVGKIQEIISVGAVVLDENLNTVTEYESYIGLSLTSKLDPSAQKVHKIKMETLEGARDFKTVFRELVKVLDLKDGDIIMTWGGNDRAGIISNSIAHNCEEEFKVLIDKVVNICRETQSKVRYKGKELKNTLGLETLRLVCGIEQENSHNALDDARCLAEVYKYTHDKEEVSNDAVLDAIFAEKEAKKEAKKQMFESYYKRVDEFGDKYEEGMVLNNLSKKAMVQIKHIVNEPTSKSSFKDLTKSKGEIKVGKSNYLVRDNSLVKNTKCRISIKKRTIKIDFEKDNKKYYCNMPISKSNVDRVSSLIRTLESECA